MTRNIVTAVILAVAFPLTAIPVEAHHETAAKANPGSAQLAEGEVRKVDKDARKITLKHGPIQNLGMPAMTMVFQVKDPALLDQVKAGDKVRFFADKIGGGYVVTGIETTK